MTSTTQIRRQLVVIGALQRPAANDITLGLHDTDRLGDPLVRRDARLPDATPERAPFAVRRSHPAAWSAR